MADLQDDDFAGDDDFPGDRELRGETALASHTSFDDVRPVHDDDGVVLEAEEVFLALHEIMAYFTSEGLAKDQRNERENFDFRGIDQVMNALSGLLVDNHLIITPKVLTHKLTERTNARESIITFSSVTVEYEARSLKDNSTTVCVMAGEASDYGDKATNKALSAAYKYMAIQWFCIPTKGDNDADASDPGYTTRFDREEDRSRERDREDDRRDSRDRAPPRESERRTQSSRDPRDDDRNRGDTGRKNASQARKDGDWDKLIKGINLQRSEEELKAWAKGHERDLDRLPHQWKILVREKYADHLEEVRKRDAERYGRERDGGSSSFDTGEGSRSYESRRGG